MNEQQYTIKWNGVYVCVCVFFVDSRIFSLCFVHRLLLQFCKSCMFANIIARMLESSLDEDLTGKVHNSHATPIHFNIEYKCA